MSEEENGIIEAVDVEAVEDAAAAIDLEPVGEKGQNIRQFPFLLNYLVTSSDAVTST